MPWSTWSAVSQRRSLRRPLGGRLEQLKACVCKVSFQCIGQKSSIRVDQVKLKYYGEENAANFAAMCASQILHGHGCYPSLALC